MTLYRINNIILSAAFLAGLASSLISSTLLAVEHQRLRDVSAAECGSCHKEIYSQWKTSMHASSTALKDPIHGAFYKAVIGPPDQEGLKKWASIQYAYNAMHPVQLKMGKQTLPLLRCMLRVSVV